MAGRGAAGNAVRVVVAGEAKTGKSSLILTALFGNFLSSVSPVLPPVRMHISPYPIPVTVIDTSSRTEDRGKLVEELKRADVVVFTHSWDRPDTLGRLINFWLPYLRELQVDVPVIVVGCMLDKRGDQHVSLKQVMSPIMQQFWEIRTCLQCSALNHIQINEVFRYAQKAVLYPIAPLFDHEQQVIKPHYQSALKRIFNLCDHDRDGFLIDVELNDFLVKCFNAQLQPSEIESVKRRVQEKLLYVVNDQLWEGVNDQLREGVNDRGLTLTGFICLNALFIESGHLEKAWAVLRKFGYNNEIRLRGDQLPPPVKRYPDQCVELTSEVVQFLKSIFDSCDADHDGVLSSHEFEDLFSTAPENPFREAPYVDAGAMTAFEGPSLNLFLSLWALMTLLDPIRSVETLVYLGYGGDLSSAMRVTRGRRLDCEKQQSERSVYQCFVFGPKESGKSTLLNSFIGRPVSETYVATVGDKYAVKIVEPPSGHEKTLVLREISSGVNELLLEEDALSACDVAVFVYDSSLEPSWKKAEDMLRKVAKHGKECGYEVPCLIVSAKGDLEPYLTESQDSKRACLEMGIDAPIRLGTILDSDVIGRIVTAAEHPHLNIPVLDRIVRAAEYHHLSFFEGESREHYHRLLNRSLVYISGGAAIAIAIAGYFAYKKKSST